MTKVIKLQDLQELKGKDSLKTHLLELIERKVLKTYEATKLQEER